MHDNRTFHRNGYVTVYILLQVKTVYDIYLCKSPITWISLFYCDDNGSDLSLNPQYI